MRTSAPRRDEHGERDLVTLPCEHEETRREELEALPWRHGSAVVQRRPEVLHAGAAQVQQDCSHSALLPPQIAIRRLRQGIDELEQDARRHRREERRDAGVEVGRRRLGEAALRRRPRHQAREHDASHVQSGRRADAATTATTKSRCIHGGGRLRRDDVHRWLVVIGLALFAPLLRFAHVQRQARPLASEVGGARELCARPRGDSAGFQASTVSS